MHKFTFCRTMLVVVCMLVLPDAAMAQNPARTDIVQTELVKVKVETVLEGLDRPWGMNMLPDGRLLVTERPGRLLLIDPENSDTNVSVPGTPKVWARGQGGLLDIAIDPDFENNRTLFMTFADPDGQGNAGTAVASAQLNETSGTPHLTNLAIIYSMKKKTAKGQHFGSRIVFDHHGNLFFTIGDRGERDRAQDPFDAAGSVMRIKKDGTIPKDNPAFDGKHALREIWSIGHRNPQGATLDEKTGKLWTLAHGARGGDEINQPQAGRNYGWPAISYGTHYSGKKIGLGKSAPGYEQPVYFWDPSIAPSGLDFYDADLIPQWKGNLFAGALKFKMLVRLEMQDGKVVHEEHLFKNRYGRIRNVRTLHDGALWLLTDSENGKILRVTRAK